MNQSYLTMNLPRVFQLQYITARDLADQKVETVDPTPLHSPSHDLVPPDPVTDDLTPTEPTSADPNREDDELGPPAATVQDEASDSDYIVTQLNKEQERGDEPFRPEPPTSDVELDDKVCHRGP